MNHPKSTSSRENVLAAILSQENFWPAEPQCLSDTGLPVSYIESLVCKRLLVVGLSSGRQLAKNICIPFALMEPVFQSLRERQILVHKGSAPLNDYTYALTEKGMSRARADHDSCAYSGPAPVPLVDYVVSAEAQTIRHESPKRRQLEEAFKDISVDQEIFNTLGPSVNSGAGLFLYGAPGNGKTTLAKRVIRCFGQQVWIPHALIDDGQIIKLYDPALHEAAEETESSISFHSNFDPRWIRIRRPTVIVGGELTMDSLEIRHDPHTNISEAPLQLKSNCGCFLIDDFGRQRIEPTELLNRWIVPLESRIDFLTLSTGKKIQVPFEQLIVFSTNLDPSDLVDEAFLRRIPYKVFVGDPERQEFHDLFRFYSQNLGCEYRPDVVETLLAKHYFTVGRELRRCHPRDLLTQVRNYCVYNDIRIEMRDEYFDTVVRSYFASNVLSRPEPSDQPAVVTSPVPCSKPQASPLPAPPPTHTMQCNPSELVVAGHQPPVVAGHPPPVVAGHQPPVVAGHQPPVVAGHPPAASSSGSPASTETQKPVRTQLAQPVNRVAVAGPGPVPSRSQAPRSAPAGKPNRLPHRSTAAPSNGNTSNSALPESTIACDPRQIAQSARQTPVAANPPPRKSEMDPRR